YVFTAPVKSFSATSNSHDLTGNVAEWVRNCGNEDYCAAGGSWMKADLATAQGTETVDPNKALSHVGIRLVKTIK
ncbi:MAG: formylglycine-generating enzyme family protein, partial [Proteobacteria bacterium]|nr:formylglycine-generating enzyme family protein [Pseudomonadota bacterium]